MTTRYIPNRKWGQRSMLSGRRGGIETWVCGECGRQNLNSTHCIGCQARRRREGVGQFSTKLEGFQNSRRTWICVNCWGWNNATTAGPGRPKTCFNCEASLAKKGEAYRCDSDVETRWFTKLLDWVVKGEITELVHHPRFELRTTNRQGAAVLVKSSGRVIVYEADASYVDHSGRPVVGDVKPKNPAAQTDVFKLKRAFVEAQLGYPLTIVS